MVYFYKYEKHHGIRPIRFSFQQKNLFSELSSSLIRQKKAEVDALFDPIHLHPDSDNLILFYAIEDNYPAFIVTLTCSRIIYIHTN